MSKTPKCPRDPNQLAKFITDLATGEAEEPNKDETDPNVVELGRRGGLVGGKARANKLTPEQRTEIAKRRHKSGGILRHKIRHILTCIFS
jgi:hypothetical protein